MSKDNLDATVPNSILTPLHLQPQFILTVEKPNMTHFLAKYKLLSITHFDNEYLISNYWVSSRLNFEECETGLY